MAYQFKVGDTGKTRDGRAYRVVATDMKGTGPLAVIILDTDGREYVTERRACGMLFSGVTDRGDLIPPTPAVYINVYEDGGEIFVDLKNYETRKAADRSASDRVERIGCIRVPLEARYDD